MTEFYLFLSPESKMATLTMIEKLYYKAMQYAKLDVIGSHQGKILDLQVTPRETSLAGQEGWVDIFTLGEEGAIFAMRMEEEIAKEFGEYRRKLGEKNFPKSSLVMASLYLGSWKTLGRRGMTAKWAATMNWTVSMLYMETTF